MRKSVRGNYLLNLGYQILSLLTPLITTPYVSRVLGAEQIGRYSYAGSIVSYFTLFATMGTTIYGQREISYCQEDRYLRSVNFWSIEVISLISSTASLIVYLIYTGFSSRNTGILFTILSMNIINVAVDITWLYQGMEEFPTIVARNVIIRIVNVAGIFIFVNSRDDLINYVVLGVVTTLAGSCSLWLGCGKYISFIPFSSLEITRHLPGLLFLFVPSIATTLYTQIDKTMLGLLTTSSFENGYYEQAMKISKITLTLTTSLGTVMIPRISSYYAEGKTVLIEQTLYKSFRFVTLLGCPLSLGLVGISSVFVPWYFGSGYEQVINVLRILSFHNIIIAFSNVSGMQYLIPTGQQNKLTLSVFSGAFVNFILNLLLIPKWFATGAAGASVVSEAVVTLIQLSFMRNIFSPKKLYAGTWRYFFCAGFMLAVIRVENIWMSPSALSTLIMITSGALVYVLSLLILKDGLVLEALTTLLRKVR